MPVLERTVCEHDASLFVGIIFGVTCYQEGLFGLKLEIQDFLVWRNSWIRTLEPHEPSSPPHKEDGWSPWYLISNPIERHISDPL
ncbi:hypothetical protein TB2_016156 [Malus domestica]